MSAHHSKGALEALYRVVVAPALSTGSPPHSRFPQQASRPIQGVCGYASPRAFCSSPSRLSKTREPEKRQQKWDEEITAPMIILKNPSGELSEPGDRRDILNRLDRKDYRLIQLTPDEPGNSHFIPICRIVSKKEEYTMQKERRKKEQEKKREQNKVNSVKTLELNWAIDRNDLAHRLERVEGFLTEGRRVEMVLASKKRGRKADRAECEEVLKQIDNVVDAVKGAKLLKPIEGKVGGFATLVLQGPARSGEAKTGGDSEAG